MLGGLAQALLLGLGQGVAGIEVQGAGILQLRAQAVQEELGRQFVLLRVGGVSVLGDRPLAHLARKGRLRAWAGPDQLAARIGDQQGDRRPTDDIGKRRALKGVDGGGDQAHGGKDSTTWVEGRA